MRLAKFLDKLTVACFLLMWIPFAWVMINIGNMPTQESFLANPWVYAMLVLFVGTFVFFFASLIVGWLSNQRILASGQDAQAKILAIASTGTTINDNPVIEFSLRVQPANHPAFVAQARHTVSIINLPSFQPGSILNVKFVPGTDRVAIVGPRV